MDGKIPIVGLGNAGKTSLIRTLIREFKSLDDLKPTKGIERTKIGFLGRDLMLWDFGGQAKYRNDYKKKADAYFSEIQDIIYVVDVQDQTQFNEVIVFFKEITESLKQFSPTVTINIFFNKIDPGMEQDQGTMQLVDALGKKLTEDAKGLAVRIFYTSIFNPMSVIRAFSKPIFGNSTMHDNLSILCMDVIQQKNMEFITITTPGLIEIGGYFSPTVDQTKMKAMGQEIIRTFEDKKMKLNDVKLQTGDTAMNIIQFEVSGKIFYFIYGYDIRKHPEASGAVVAAFNLLEDVKKFMKYL